MKQNYVHSALISGLQGLLLLLVLSSCAMSPTATNTINDPIEPLNRVIFDFNDRIDRYALKPVAEGYKSVTPTFLRRGFNNFFGNLADVSTAVNGVLQVKFKQGFSDTARVAVNTVIGLGGFIDVASRLDFKKHNEDFGQTLGVWGIPEGPYVVLPLFGPYALRGGFGL